MRIKRGETIESLLKKIDKYPVSKSLKSKLKEKLRSLNSEVNNDDEVKWKIH